MKLTVRGTPRGDAEIDVPSGFRARVRVQVSDDLQRPAAAAITSGVVDTAIGEVRDVEVWMSEDGGYEAEWVTGAVVSFNPREPWGKNLTETTWHKAMTKMITESLNAPNPLWQKVIGPKNDKGWSEKKKGVTVHAAETPYWDGFYALHHPKSAYVNPLHHEKAKAVVKAESKWVNDPMYKLLEEQYGDHFDLILPDVIDALNSKEHQEALAKVQKAVELMQQYASVPIVVADPTAMVDVKTKFMGTFNGKDYYMPVAPKPKDWMKHGWTP